ncbi:zinc finger MYND domain-containing protein 10 [Planoprotostelium fungivorum]|uniref:Zinc finger MYND domain-containing protein 10 n=1 Tax=Planoprotostelium fungivorum TaxID=1890364 RepID=A0A2P6NPR5_9EUKA|nr:zinc finger MYND domain-containing protein 10 [Planoprotostelium fungivorum]
MTTQYLAQWAKLSPPEQQKVAKSFLENYAQLPHAELGEQIEKMVQLTTLTGAATAIICARAARTLLSHKIILKLFDVLSWAMKERTEILEQLTSVLRQFTVVAGFVDNQLFPVMLQQDLLTFSVRTIKKISKMADNVIDPAASANLLAVITSLSDPVQGKDELTLLRNAEKLIDFDIRLMLSNSDTFICSQALRNIEYIRPYASEGWKDKLVDRMVEPSVWNRLLKYLEEDEEVLQEVSLSLLGDIAFAKASPVLAILPIILKTMQETSSQVVRQDAIKCVAGVLTSGSQEERATLVGSGGMKVLDHIREEVTAQQTFVGQALAELLDKGFLEQVLAYRPSIVNDVCYLFHFYHSADGSDDAAPRAFIHSSNCLINLSKGNKERSLQIIQSGVPISLWKACFNPVLTELLGGESNLQNHLLILDSILRLARPEEMEKMERQNRAIASRIPNRIRDVDRLRQAMGGMGITVSEPVLHSMYNPEIMQHVCLTCGLKNPGKRCSKCSAAAYCSRECQVKDWPTHKRICKPSK